MNHWCSTNLNQTGFVLFSVGNQVVMRCLLAFKLSRSLSKIHICGLTRRFFFPFSFFFIIISTSIQGQVTGAFSFLWLRQIICLSYKKLPVVLRTGWRDAGHGCSCSSKKSSGGNGLTKGLWATALQLLTSAVNLSTELSPTELLAALCF